MGHNKYLTFLVLEINDLISAKSASQKLHFNLGKAFLLFRFLIAILCICSAICSFTLNRDPVFLSKTYRPYLLILFNIHHISDL